ncbi:MAG: sulfite exporter TauE/SafE family protein [Panacagrimonas sp.]
MESILIYLATGLMSGLMAGLFGIGGGMIMVPALALVLPAQGIGETLLMHVAIGTSLAVIAATSISSTLSHHRRDGVMWDRLLAYGPGLALGALAGAFVAETLSSDFLRRLVGVSSLLIAAQMATNFQFRALKDAKSPATAELVTAGGVIGLLSALLGIGGGSLTTPYLSLRGFDLRKAVGTSAAGGIPIAWAGALGYVVSGWNAPGLAPFSLGFVNLGGFAAMAVASVMAAPLGARLAHGLSPRHLQLAFSLLLLLVGLHMLLG